MSTFSSGQIARGHRLAELEINSGVVAGHLTLNERAAAQYQTKLLCTWKAKTETKITPRAVVLAVGRKLELARLLVVGHHDAYKLKVFRSHAAPQAGRQLVARGGRMLCSELSDARHTVGAHPCETHGRERAVSVWRETRDMLTREN